MNMEYIAVVVAFAILGCYVFMLYRWWYNKLTHFAVRYDVVVRRQQAAWRYPIVMLSFMFPVVVILSCSLRYTNVDKFFILIAFVVCIAPGIIWWTQRMKKLAELGYGRNK